MDNYLWTKHSEWKMKQYSLSQQRLKRVVRNPDRIEKSIVPGMVAAMQVAGNSKRRYEVWVMYEVAKNQKSQAKGQDKETATQAPRSETQDLSHLSPAARFREMRRQEFAMRQSMGSGKTLRVISAWKYPGESPKRDPIPVEILEEIQRLK